MLTVEWGIVHGYAFVGPQVRRKPAENEFFYTEKSRTYKNHARR
ncbi:hypothetical protein [Armatimonas sp.]